MATNQRQTFRRLPGQPPPEQRAGPDVGADDLQPRRGHTAPPRMRPGHHQSIFPVFQLRPNISSGANMAVINYVPILWDVFYRLFISHVLLGTILSIT